MINVFLLFFSCLGNDEPKFETYNGQPIKYLFGFAYVGSLMDQEFVVEAGETLDMEFGIRDPNGDSFEMWFPAAPEGLDFLKDETKGTWTVPQVYHQEFATFQVLAVDERGAAGSLFLNYYINGVEIPRGTRALLSGWINTATHDVRLRLQYEGCEFLGGNWDHPASVPLSVTPVENCQNCDLAYHIEGFSFTENTQGETSVDSGDNSDTGISNEEPPDPYGWGCRNLFDLQDLQIAFADNWDEGYQNTVLLYREPLWVPQGTGDIEATEFSFTLELYTEETLYEEEDVFGMPF